MRFVAVVRGTGAGWRRWWRAASSAGVAPQALSVAPAPPTIDAASLAAFDDGPIAALSFDAAPPHHVHDATPSLWRLRGDAVAPAWARLDELLEADDIHALLAGGGAAGSVRLRRADGGQRHCVARASVDEAGVARHRLQLVDADWLAQAGWQPAGDGARLQLALARTRAAQRFLQVLQHVTELLQGCDGVEQAGRIIADGGRELFPGWDGALTQADAGGAMRILDAWGETRVAEDASREDECWALRLRRLHRAGAQRTPVCRHWGADGLPPGVTQVLCVPLAAVPEPAALHLATRRRLDDSELRSACWGAEALAGALGLALANLRLRHSLREQALRDGLTGLFNRRHFDDMLHHELSRAERTGEALTLALLDIDHFKACNDRHGHAAGDAVLRAVAVQLQSFGRAYDIACRVGGEEFAVLMPRARVGEARVRLEQLRERIAAHPMRHQGIALPAVTVSIGVASLDGGTGCDLLQCADVALYAAKGGGRNRVAVWDGRDPSIRPSPRGRADSGP